MAEIEAIGGYPRYDLVDVIAIREPEADGLDRIPMLAVVAYALGIVLSRPGDGGDFDRLFDAAAPDPAERIVEGRSSIRKSSTKSCRPTSMGTTSGGLARYGTGIGSAEVSINPG